jgi:hypothetical protein
VGSPAGLTAQTTRTDTVKDQNTATRRRRLAKLTVAEIRRLFSLIGKDDQAVDLGLRWSLWRREHQADARAHHFRRRMRLQIMQI